MGSSGQVVLSADQHSLTISDDTEPLPKHTMSEIEAIHHELHSSQISYAKKIEASYICQNDF